MHTYPQNGKKSGKGNNFRRNILKRGNFFSTDIDYILDTYRLEYEKASLAIINTDLQMLGKANRNNLLDLTSKSFTFL